jgi:outer membrane protein OmpA-like peptidoglycan-associated protein
VSDFLGTGVTTRIPILVDYLLIGPGDYFGTPVVQVKTQYALRYRAGDDPSGDPSLAQAEGTHVGTVTYDASSHRVLLIRETAQEVFWSTKGNTRRNDGVLLTFLEGMPALETGSLVKSLKETLDQKLVPEPRAELAKQPIPDVTVESDSRGVKLTLENLQFVADQAVLLPGEDKRLATISDLLKTVPGRNLLVIGHTADVGTQDSQDRLSIDRALAIVDKLKAAGIPPQRLLYEGRGGREPITSNTTEPGRAQNRRVEIVILDQ